MTELTISSTNNNSIKTTETLIYSNDSQFFDIVFFLKNFINNSADLLPSVAGILLFFP